MVELRAARSAGQDSRDWAIGNTLKAVADESVYDDLLELTRDPGLGACRLEQGPGGLAV